MTEIGRTGPSPQSILHPAYQIIQICMIGLLVGGVFLLDSVTPRGIPAWILYLVPLVLTHTLTYHQAPFIVATSCATLTLIAYFISPDLVEMPPWIPLVNRTVGVGIFGLIAFAIGQQKRMTRDLVATAVLRVEHESLQLREQMLARISQEFQDLYDNAPCGYHSLNADGLILAMNQTELDWLGYSDREIIGKKRFVELLTPSGVESFTEQFPIVLQKGQVSGLELEMLRKNRSTLPVLLHATAVTDGEGQFVSSRSTLVDITDRKRADDLLRQSHESLESDVRERTEALRVTNERLEQELITIRNMQATLKSTESRFQVMANHAPVLIWVSDLSKGRIWFNKPWLKFVGRSLEQEQGSGWAEHVHPGDCDYCLKVYESSFDAQREFKMEYRLRRHDGEWRWVLDHGVPRHEGDGVFVGFIGSCIDITEHKEALATARDSEQRLSSIFGSAMDAIITINNRQEVTDFNAAAEEMFGCTAQQAIGRPVNLFLPERFRASHSHHVATFGESSATKRRMGALGTISGLRANGEEFPIEASISQVFSRGQKLFTVILRDISQRKEAEDALKASEARFRELLEGLPQLIWTCTEDGTCDYVSPQWVTYTGVSAKEQLGNSWIQHLHPDDQASTATRWGASIGSEEQFELEFRIKGTDGGYRWFHTYITPLRGDRGRIVKWLGANTDIDDRKQAEGMLARLGAIVESSSDAIISKSLDGIVLTWNRAAERMFGYTPEETIGRSVLILLPADRRQEESNIIGRVKAGEQVQHLETLRRHKDGTLLDVSLTISPIRDAKRAVIGVSTIARDITAKKRTEEKLQQQHKLLELSQEPIFAWDMESGITQWNRGCEQLYGYAASEALGHTSYQLLRTIFPSPLPEIRAVLEAQGEWTGEVHHRTKDGQDLLVESRWGLLNANGHNLVLETNRDITQRRRFEETILKKNRDLETLLHVTSHDLKEPLRAIESFSVLIQERYADRLDVKGQDFLRRIVRATQRLDQLLTDILNLSRAQRMEPPAEEIESELLVHEVLRRLESRIKETNAKITIHSPLPRLRVNTTWAIQGIYNLITNALKFVHSGKSPEIEIASYTNAAMETGGPTYVGLVIRDRGPGVAPEHHERIFELFKRAVGREVEGTGAGLAIVRQVAERHGGRAWIASREGGGSEFFITFGAKEHGTKEA